jgi:hypothetical protein
LSKLLNVINYFFNTKFLTKNDNFHVSSYKNFFYKNNLINTNVTTLEGFKDFYQLYSFFKTKNIFNDTFLYIEKFFCLKDDFFNFFFLNSYVYRNFNTFVLLNVKSQTSIFCQYRNLIFVFFCFFKKLSNLSFSSSKFVNFKSLSHTFLNFKNVNLKTFLDNKTNDYLEKNSQYLNNTNRLIENLSNLKILDSKQVYFKDKFIKTLVSFNKDNYTILNTEQLDSSTTYSPKLVCTAHQKNLELSQLKKHAFMYLRKGKVFNKGRYSRNRQNYRTGVY